MKHNETAIAIMAGGESRRMGRDKARLELGGEPLLERIAEQAKRAADTVAVIGRTSPDDERASDLIWLEDDEPGLGPIGGLKTALTRLDCPVVLVACDMPLVDADALEWLLEAGARADATHGAATVREERVEPLFSRYTPQVLPLVDNMLAENRRSLTRLIERGDFARLRAPAAVADKLVNVNTPEQLEKVRRWID